MTAAQQVSNVCNVAEAVVRAYGAPTARITGGRYNGQRVIAEIEGANQPVVSRAVGPVLTALNLEVGHAEPSRTRKGVVELHINIETPVKALPGGR